MRIARTHGGKTVLTWAKLGYVAKDGEDGELCYTNQLCQKRAVYFRSDQVRPGTPEEIDEVLRPIREKHNEASRRYRAYKSGLKKIKSTVADVIRTYSKEPYQKVVFDLETTGLDEETDEILQISAINERGEVLINEYIKPYKKATWEEAERINNISPSMVKDCETLDHYAAEIQRIFLSATELIAYNGAFDMGFLTSFGIQIPARPYYDVMQEFAEIYGERRGDGYKWQKLRTCAEYYGYEYKPHDSLEDVKATLYCYQQMTADNKG